MHRRAAEPGRLPRKLIAIMAAFNAGSALAGSLALMAGVISLGPEVTPRLPWGSTILGGVALALVVAVPNHVLALLAVRKDRRTAAWAITVGAMLIGWIAMELAFIRELSFFHPLYVGIGLVLIWSGARLERALSGITGLTLLREARDVLVDLPVFVTSPLYRRWHLHWGATVDEVGATMLGDELLPGASYAATRAVTIHAPAEQVWPWLVQVGCLRAGFYSDDLLDNLGHPSARRILPELQDIEVGAVVPMSPHATPATSFTVAAYQSPRSLLWTKPDSTWSWNLSPVGSGETRLVTRVRAVHPWHRPIEGLLSLLLMELGDFAMMRRMLRGIEERAEAAVADH